jgi:hypothetical protein
LTISDDDKGSTTSSTSVVVNNVAPTLSNVTVTSPINENGTATLTGNIVDPGTQDTFTLVVDWGEGTPETFTFPAGTTSFSETHQYLDDNPTGTSSDTYTIGLTITDDDKGSTTSSTSVVVKNVAPTLSNVAVNSPINDGDTATLTGNISDPGTQDTFTLVVDWGEGSPQSYSFAAGTTSFSVTHQYVNDILAGSSSAIFPIGLTLSDDDGGTATAGTSVTVNHGAGATLSGVTVTPSLNEGGVATLSGSINDPDANDTFTLIVDWGEGTPETFTFPAGTTSFSVTHQYLDDNPSGTSSDVYPIGLTLHDDHAGTATASASTTVNNVAPVLSNVTVGTYNGSNQLALNGTIIDPGTQDTFTLVVNWGDGSPVDTFHYAAGTTSFTQVHLIMQPGTSQVSLTLTDDDMGSVSAFVPVQSVNTAVAGAGVGGGSEIKGFDPVTGALRFDFNAYDPGFKGGVREALGDVNGDGIPDIITVPGPGGGPLVKVFNGKDQSLIIAFNAYNPAFLGGLFVAAGDINGDGIADIVTAPDAGGGPLIEAFSGKDGTLLVSFNAYDPAFRGGVHLAVADINHDGFADIITAPGAGGGPLVEVYSGKDDSLLLAFNAYAPNFLGGVFVSAGDTNHDGIMDILTAPGAGGGPLVQSFSGKNGSLLLSVNVFDPTFRGGVHIAAGDANGDGYADIFASAASSGGPLVQVVSGKDGSLLLGINVFDPAFTDGVFVDF